MASSTYRDESKGMSTLTSGGRVGRMTSNSARTLLATWTALASDCLTTPRPTAGSPLKRAIVSSTSGPISTVATSLKRMGESADSRTTRFSYCSGWSIRPRARMLRERSCPSIRPDGSSTFSRWRRLRMSVAVTCRAAILAESSQIRMEGRFSPPKLIPPTPGSTWSRSLIWRSARLVSSRVERVALERATHITSWALASCLATIGSLMSSGSLSRTRLIRSRTSWAPVSTS